MPFSHSAQISTIVGFAELLQPASVLDVGAGMGQYGVLLRNHLEHEHLFEVTGSEGRQRPRDEWRVRIDGIEGFAGYLTPVHAWAYQEMRIGNALDLLPAIPAGQYDLVIAIDILEHFETGGDAGEGNDRGGHGQSAQSGPQLVLAHHREGL